MGKEFGSRLKRLRESKGYSTYEESFPKLVGISPPNLVSIEKGRRPASDAVLRRIAEIEELGVTFEQLKAWQALDDYDPAAIFLAAQELAGEPVTEEWLKERWGQPGIPWADITMRHIREGRANQASRAKLVEQLRALPKDVLEEALKTQEG